MQVTPAESFGAVSRAKGKCPLPGTPCRYSSHPRDTPHNYASLYPSLRDPVLECKHSDMSGISVPLDLELLLGKREKDGKGGKAQSLRAIFIPAAELLNLKEAPLGNFLRC